MRTTLSEARLPTLPSCSGCQRIARPLTRHGIINDSIMWRVAISPLRDGKRSKLLLRSQHISFETYGTPAERAIDIDRSLFHHGYGPAESFMLHKEAHPMSHLARYLIHHSSPTLSSSCLDKSDRELPYSPFVHRERLRKILFLFFDTICAGNSLVGEPDAGQARISPTVATAKADGSRPQSERNRNKNPHQPMLWLHVGWACG